MDGTTVSALTEVLMDILLGAFALSTITWAIYGIQSVINAHKDEKREQAKEQRDAEYHLERMKEFSK